MGVYLDKTLKEKLSIIDLSKRANEFVKFRVPTGIVAFDRVFGGGIPAGRLTEFYGDYATGKSRILYHVLAQTIRMDGIAVLLDVERSFSSGLAKLTNLDESKLWYPDPNTLNTYEEIFDVIEKTIALVREKYPGKFLVIGLDSVAASTIQEDLEKKIGRPEAAMRRAKVISDGLRRNMGNVYKNKIGLVFINQIRDNIGVMYGPDVTTIGGRALKFYASLRVHVKTRKQIRDERAGETVGYAGSIIVEKSRVSKPFQRVEFEMRVDQPIDKYAGLLDYMRRHGEVEHVGAGWYQFSGDTEKFRGSEFVAKYKEKFEKEKTK